MAMGISVGFVISPSRGASFCVGKEAGGGAFNKSRSRPLLVYLMYMRGGGVCVCAGGGTIRAGRGRVVPKHALVGIEWYGGEGEIESEKAIRRSSGAYKLQISHNCIYVCVCVCAWSLLSTEAVVVRFSYDEVASDDGGACFLGLTKAPRFV